MEKNKEFLNINGVEYVMKSKVDEIVNKAIVDTLAKSEYTELPIGAIVCLNSGGPEMTVCSPIREIPDNKVVRCAWFTEDCELHIADFAISALFIVDDEDNYPTPPAN